MIIKLGAFKFGKGSKIKELCPLCLENRKLNHNNCFPKGSILIKKENYILLRISSKEPIVKRMLEISENSLDESKEFNILYINKTFVGYKGLTKTWFVPSFIKDKYKNILIEYLPRSEKIKNKVTWKYAKENLNEQKAITNINF